MELDSELMNRVSKLSGGLLPALMIWKRHLREEAPPLERTMSVTAELASSAFRKRLKAQSERLGCGILVALLRTVLQNELNILDT